MEVKKVNGELFRSLVINGCENLKLNYQYIDSLNVFPVPDGDTGTNMRLTIEGGVNEVLSYHEDNIYDMAKKISRGMLMGARGNSGVILSQLFRGISKGFEDKTQVDAIRLAHAFQKGVEQSYKAVMKPTEGTILTVAREGAEKMNKIANSKMTINEFFREYLAELKESLQRTPDLLPVLKEAGVVDSGGAGFVVIIEGMLKYLEGEVIDASVAVEKQEEDSETKILEGYSIEFLLELKKDYNINTFDEKVLEDSYNTFCTEVTVKKDDSVIRVHVHSFSLGDVFNEATQYGELVKVKVENMRIQHTEPEVLTHVNEGECPCGEEHYTAPVKPEIRSKYAICSVGTGTGLCDIFKALGTDVIVSGGQSMNPSTEDFIRAFDTLNADNIIVFPNNKNIILAANQAAKIYTESKVTVIETKSLAQGYSALTMMDLTLELDDIVNDLKEVISSVVSAQVTYSVRDTELSGIKIAKGDFIGICDNKIVTSRHSRYDAVKDLLRQSGAAEKDAITIIYGSDANLKEVNQIQRHIERNYNNLEVDVVKGDQDVYSYIFVLS